MHVGIVPLAAIVARGLVVAHACRARGNLGLAALTPPQNNTARQNKPPPLRYTIQVLAEATDVAARK